MTKHQIEELMESQERLVLAMDAGNLCSWEIDLQNLAMKCSANAAEILGFPVPDTLEAVNALVHPDDRELVNAAGQETIVNRTPYVCEYRLMNPVTGGIRWFHSQGGVKQSPRTGRLIFVGVTQDISDRKQNEAVQEQKEEILRRRAKEQKAMPAHSNLTREKYEALFNSIDEGFCILEKINPTADEDTDFRFLDVNPAFGKLTGISNASGRSMKEAFPAEAAEWIPFYDKVYRTGESVKFDGDLLTTGQHLESFAYHIPGHPQPQVAVLFIDITSRKRRERDEQFMSLVSHQLTRMHDAEEIMQLTGARLGWHGRFSRCLFIEIQPGGESVWVNRHWQQHGVPVIQGFFARDAFIADRDMEEARNAGVLIAGGSKQAGAPLSKILAGFGVQSALLFPFFRGQEISFIVCLTGEQMREWTAPEIHLARTVAVRLWTAVDHSRFEKALKESETRLQQALSIETVGVIFINERGKFINANDAFCRMSGYSPAELSSGSIGWQMLTPPEWIEKGTQGADELKKTGRTTPYEKEYFRKDGSRFWALVAASRISGKETVVYVIDINDRRKAVNALESAEAEQRNMTTRLNLALDAGRLGSYDYHLANGSISCSPQCKANFGLGDREFLNFDRLVSLILPEDRKSMMAAVKDALALNQEYHAEYRVRRPDGSVTWIRASGKPVFENDVPVRLVGITQDIMKEKDLAALLNRQVAERTLELNRSNDDLMQFAHVASHDLKEPVRKVRIFTSMLKEELGDSMTLAGDVYIDKIQKAVDRMVSMIDGVLTYSKINAASDVFQTINLNTVMDQIVRDLELPLQEKKALIRYHNLPSFEGMGMLIYQLFYNLIYNALKFSKENCPSRIGIDAAYETDGMREWVVVQVADNGIGIDNEYREKIFESFVRLNAKSEYEGTGLGLSLCRKIVLRHKGTITASGVNGTGSVFTVRMPVKQN